ncbi:MAG: AAA family ATPase [Anaerolineae bacterium]|nr:AAA family ATPase [Anaerolineae bacterium]
MTKQLPSPTKKNIYTDAPDLHPNLILGSVQLFIWLFFHPSAWANYITRIDPRLSADFCLLELDRTSWRMPAIQRLLVITYLIYPFLLSLLAGSVLWILNWVAPNILIQASPERAVKLIFLVLGYTWLATLTVSLTASVASGLVYGTMLGLAIALIDGVTNRVVVGPAFGLAAGLASSIAITTSRDFDNSLTKHLGGVTLGVLITILTLFPLWSVTRNLSILTHLGYVEAILPSVILGLLAGLSLTLIIGWRTGNWSQALKYAPLFGLASGFIYYFILVLGEHLVVRRFVVGVGAGIFFGTNWVIPYIAARRVGGTLAGAVVSAFVAGTIWVFVPNFFEQPIPLWPTLPLTLIVILLTLLIFRWRPILFYPFFAAYNILLYNLDQRRLKARASLFHYHAAFWDEHQLLRWLGLEDYLVLIAGRYPSEGQAAATYLINSDQRWAAQAAQIELKIAELEKCQTIVDIAQAHYSLPLDSLEGQIGGLLHRFSYISQDVDVALKRVTIYHQRQELSSVINDIKRLQNQLVSGRQKDVTRLQNLVKQWHILIDDHIHRLIKELVMSQKVDNPYICGPVLTEENSTFIKRTQTIMQIEQSLLNGHRPSLLLYGQRRMGKTTLLKNIGCSLPRTIVPLFVDGQGSSIGNDYADFLHNLSRQMQKSAKRHDLNLPPPDEDRLIISPLSGFDEWLDIVEETLEHEGRNIAILIIDEFEAIDRVIEKGRFEAEDMLSLLRNLIQHRPMFRVLLASSHPLEEFQRWSSYLINMQTVKISYLNQDDARKLVESPVEGFGLSYEQQAVTRVLELTRGHPFLLQKLCFEIVNLKNQQDAAIRRGVRPVDVEAAAEEVLKPGNMLLEEIEQHQIGQNERALLRFIARQGEGAIINKETLSHHVDEPYKIEQMLVLLLQRDLIESVDTGYRFQVELMRRWFAASR